MMIGRIAEKEKLIKAYESEYSQFVTVYGRRRVGKTFFIPAVYSDITMISKDLLMAEIGGDEETNVVFTTDGKMQKCTE